MSEMILCEAQYNAGFPAKVMYYRYADQKKDKNGNIIRVKLEILKGVRYLVAKKVVEVCEEHHKKAISKSDVGGVHQAYKKLLWKRVK